MIRPGIYRLFPQRVSLREFARILPGPQLAYPLVMAKLLRLWWPRSYIVQPLPIGAINPRELPLLAASRLESPVVQLQETGFRAVSTYHVDNVTVLMFGTLLVSADGMSLAAVVAAFAEAGVERLITKLISIRTDDRRIVTTSESQFLDDPPDRDIRYFPGADVPSLLRSHLSHVSGQPLRRVPEDYFGTIVDQAEHWLQYQVHRGTFRWAAPERSQMSRSLLRA